MKTANQINGHQELMLLGLITTAQAKLQQLNGGAPIVNMIVWVPTEHWSTALVILNDLELEINGVLDIPLNIVEEPTTKIVLSTGGENGINKFGVILEEDFCEEIDHDGR